jgi:hypothetical protein
MTSSISASRVVVQRMIIEEQPPGGWRYLQQVEACPLFSLVFVVDSAQGKVRPKSRGWLTPVRCCSA